ncbi:Extracellular metalloprotease that contributes to pathogenicity [Geosmithia morbida]|uniref:Carboxypeptidase M14B n=1 Tax=Geosmithia morbida TaxID=1094350 RepID=A0A9P4YRY9_9HYPO|nr:Extracellular metalloprotease that contributes to pathogenicity [Geosmithia morbida]KAF4120742.1 Extracellular metalloprotease that contributes to pathogenicity [Geosmithia morbida]
MRLITGLLLSPLAGLISVASASKYGYNHVTVIRDSDKVVEGAFPDVNFDIVSPDFMHPDRRQPGFSNGTQGPTSWFHINTTDSFIQSLASPDKNMKFGNANFRSEERQGYPYVHVSKANATSPKIRIWIQASVHGNEPAGEEAAMAILGKLSTNKTWADSVLDKVELFFLPRYNPDGVFYFQRALATNLDPNRDHTKLERQVSRDIKQLFSDFNPHIAIDMHEYSAFTEFGDGAYVHGSDGLFAAAKNLNIRGEIRNLSEELFAKNIARDMEAAGLRTEPYVTGRSSSYQDVGYVAEFSEAGSDARIGRNAMGLTQTVSFLLETRGIGLADQEYGRRTASGFTMCGSIIQTAVDNADRVLETIEAGIDAFVNSSNPIVVTDHGTVDTRPFTMVDKNNGTVVKMPVRFESTTPTIANLTRTRPEAYLIPIAWDDIAKRLHASGVEVENLKQPWEGTVEALTIESAILDTSYYEGSVLTTTTTTAAERHVRLPAGSFLVSTRQKNAGLAMVALEPEGIDSYVTFNIIPVEKGDEYPIFRVM